MCVTNHVQWVSLRGKLVLARGSAPPDFGHAVASDARFGALTVLVRMSPDSVASFVVSFQWANLVAFEFHKFFLAGQYI